MKIGEISKIVERILNNDPMARNDDRYLYLEVVREIKPSVLYEPFAMAYMDKDLPSTETVRRSRQKVQEQNPNLGADSDVVAMRDIKEQEFFEFAIKGW